MPLQGSSRRSVKCEKHETRNEGQVDDGVSRSSKEVSNDHGAKGWQRNDNAKGKLMSVHRIDGKQQTTKLERIGKLAETKKEVVFNNLHHAIDLHLLRESYHQLDGRLLV